jgi:hypothetical protein
MQMDEKQWSDWLRTHNRPADEKIDLSGQNYNNILSALRKGHGFHPTHCEEQKDPALAIAQSLHIFQPICTSPMYVPVLDEKDQHRSMAYGHKRYKYAWALVYSGIEGIAITSEPWSLEEEEQHRRALGMNWSEHAKQVPHSTRLHLRVWKWWFCPHKHQRHRNLGRCYNEYTCTDCGYSYTVDSSD